MSTDRSSRGGRAFWRWSRRLLIAVALILLLLRISHPVWLPRLVEHFADQQGLALEYGDLDFSFLGGRIELGRVVLAKRTEESDEEASSPAPPSLVALDFLGLDLDLSALFTGTLRVHRAEVDGVTLRALRDAEGVWNFHGLPLSTTAEEDGGEAEPDAESVAPTATDSTATAARPLDFRLPLEIDAAVLHGVRVVLRDDFIDPPLDTVLSLDVAARDLGQAELPARIQVQLWCPEVLEALHAEVVVQAGLRSLDARGSFALKGLDVQRLAPYLVPLGLTPEAAALHLEGEFDAQLAPMEGSETDLSGELSLGPLGLRADDEECLALDSLVLRVARASSMGARIETLALSGLRGRAARDVAGRLRVAGLRFDGAPNEEEGEKKQAESEAVSPVDGAPPFILEVGRATLKEARFLFEDATVEPAAQLELEAWGELGDLILGRASGEAERPSPPISIDGGLRLVDGGVFRVRGQGLLAAEGLDVAVTLEGTEVTGGSLAPYLAAAGWEFDLTAGSLDLPLRAQVRWGDELGADLEVGPLVWRDGSRELLALEGIALEGFRLSDNGDTRVDAVTLRGLKAAAHLGPEGGLAFLGLRSLGDKGPRPSMAEGAGAEDAQAAAPAAEGTESPAREAGGAGASEPAESGSDPGFSLGRLTLEDCTFVLRGDHFEPALDLTLEAALSLTGLRLGGDPADNDREPATLAIELGAEGLVERMVVKGTLLACPGPLDLELDLALEAEGLRADAMAGPLRARGLEGNLDSGLLRGVLSAALRETPAGVGIALELKDFGLVDGDRELVALNGLRIDEVLLLPDGVAIGEVVVRGPRLALARTRGGALDLPGVRVLPSVADGRAGARSPMPAENPRATAPSNETPPQTFFLGELRLEGARVHWRDEAVEPPVDIALAAQAQVRGLDTRRDAPPLSFEVRASVEGTLDELLVEGQGSLDPASLALDSSLTLRGLRAGPLLAYFPPGLEPTLEDGRLGLHVSAASGIEERGGRALRLELSDLAFGDGEAELLRLERFLIDVPRFDSLGQAPGAAEDSKGPGGGVYDIEALTLDGLKLRAEKTASGLEFLGLRLVETDAGATTPRAGGEAASADTAVVPEPADPSTRRPPPSLRLGELRVGVEEFLWLDRAGGGEPARVSFALTSDGPQMLCDADPEALPPLRFLLSGRAAPLLDAVRVGMELSPFGGEPQLGVDVQAEGFRGAALTRVWPDLAPVLDASALEEGSFGARLEAVLRFARRGPLDFDLGRGFGAELALVDVALRPRPEGEALFAFERLDVALQRYQPATGEARIQSIELVGTRARVRQTTEGLAVAGLLLKTQPAPAGVAGATEADSTDPVSPKSEPAPEVVSADTASGEVRVDELLMTGLDFLFEDATVEPPFLLPITDMEVEVKGLSSRVLEEPRSVSFRALLDAGEVSLPERSGSDNLLVGVLGSLAEAATLSDEKFELESRPVWDQFEVTGRVALVPEPKGRVTLVLNGLELPAFRGLASRAGVVIGDGLLDTQLGLRLRGAEGLGLNLHTSLDSLSLSEPPDGPISQYLRLPAPLDTVLFLLRNEEGRQEIPLRVSVPPEGVSAGSVATAAATALGTLIVDALSSAPARLLGPLTGLVDQLGLTPTEPSAETVVLSYLPGTTLPGYHVAEELGPLLETLRARPDLRLVIQHELGQSDLDLAQRLANPDPAHALELVTRLRDQKAAVARERGEMAALVRAQWAVGESQAAEENTAHLRHLDTEAVAVEEALDRVLALMRPGAERRRTQRTRLAALSLARERMRLLEEWILHAGGQGLAAQLDLRRPRFPTPGTDDAPLSSEGSISLTPKDS